MSLQIQFDKENYGPDGLIKLFSGDDWNLTGRIIDLIGPTRNRYSLAGLDGASAFFPAASGGFMSALVTVVDPFSGQININVAASDSPNATISDVPIQPFVTLEQGGETQTVVPLDVPVVITTRGASPYP